MKLNKKQKAIGIGVLIFGAYWLIRSRKTAPSTKPKAERSPDWRLDPLTGTWYDNNINILYA